MNIKPDAWIDTQDLELMREKGRGAIVWHHKQDGYAQTALYVTQPPQDERGRRLTEKQEAELWSAANEFTFDTWMWVLRAELAAEPEQPVALSTLTDERMMQIHNETWNDGTTSFPIDCYRRIAREAAILAASAPAQQAANVTDEMMDLADRLGSEADNVDPQAWEHLLIYAPKNPIVTQAEGWELITPKGNVVATENTCIKALARISGYKLNIEGLLGFEEKGWRVRPTHEQSTPPQPVAAEVADKARRYDWLKARLLCADFRYGEPSETCCALVFEIPEDMRVSANLDETIDDAMAGTGSDESKGNGNG